jgi:hypothetical protein
MAPIKVLASQAHSISRYKNITKVMKCCANSYFNRQRLFKKVVPKYADIKILYTSPTTNITQKINSMGSHNVCSHWMYQYCVLCLAWWWLNEPKHVAEFLILFTNMCSVIRLNKLLYYCKTQRDGSYQRIHKSSPPASILSQMNPVHAPSYFLNIHFNLSSHLRQGLQRFPFFIAYVLPKNQSTSKAFVNGLEHG